MRLTHRPVPHGISQGFGAGATRGRPHPVYGDYQPVGHTAVDFSCPTGTPIAAAAPGVVVYAGWGQNMPKHIAVKYGYVTGPDGWASGIITILDHGDGSATAYSHQNEFLVGTGTRVQGGQILGLSGTTGRSTGPHLHFEYMTLPINYGSLFYSRLDPIAQYGGIDVAGIIIDNLRETLLANEISAVQAESICQRTAELVGGHLANVFSKADGAYQNKILADQSVALGRIETSLGTKLDKNDGHSLRVAIQANSGGGDPQAVARAVIDAIGEDLAKDVITELGAALTGGK